MATHSLQTYSSGYLTKKRIEFENKCRPDRSGCLLWVGGSSSTSQIRRLCSSYPQVKFTEKGSVHTYSAHEVCYFFSTGQVPIRNVIDISHLCHNLRCVRFTHLTREPHNVNMERLTCKRTRYCHGHGDLPSCIFSHRVSLNTSRTTMYPT